MIALVTGGTRGIGLAITRALRECSHQVAVVSRSTPDHDEYDLHIRADLSYPGDRYGIVQTVVAKLGGFDLLVNNAAEQFFSPAADYAATAFDKSFAVMVSAALDLCKQAYPFMNARGGHIVNILSTTAFQGARNIVGYVTAKHALLGLTRALAVEWAPKIHVNAVAPGNTETDMVNALMSAERKEFIKSITPFGRFCRPEEIADAVVFLCQSTAIYGQVITVDGGWLAKNG